MQFTEQDREYVGELLRTQSSNIVGSTSATQVQQRLQPVALSAGAGSVGGLMKMLRGDVEGARPAHLHRVVAEAMTIKETSFFRDLTPFTLLRDRLIPKLIEERRAERRLRLWSAASSTGQEAYSLAILLRERFPQLASWDVKIIGTDISQVACEYAKRGHYRRLEINRGLPARLLLRYFERDGEEWKVSDELRHMVSFERANLCEPPPCTVKSAGMKFDIVLLRNVLLYFAAEDRARVLREVHARMQRQGVLLLGNSEQAEDSSELFRVEMDRDCYFYRPIVSDK
jgi:chemotaxis protein methyltransferase CheR